MTSDSSLVPAPGAAPLRSRVLAQARTEIRATLRNGEQLLLTLVIPVVLLVTLSRAGFVTLTEAGTRAVDVVTPGILALAVISTAFTSQAIAVGFERRYGVLRLLGSTPLGGGGLLAAKTLGVLAVEVVQLSVLVGVARILGWSPDGSWLAAFLLLLAGTLTFSALGLLLAGALRAEATLAAANAVYLLLLVGGGVVVPLAKLPEMLRGPVSLLPSAALGEGLRDVFLHGSGALSGPLVVLLAWGVAAALLTGRTFRWD